jgi:hypothetical protein
MLSYAGSTNSFIYKYHIFNLHSCGILFRYNQKLFADLSNRIIIKYIIILLIIIE